MSTYADSPVEQLEFVKDQIDPFYTRISKKQLGLPPVKIHRIPVPMSKIQKRIYNAIQPTVTLATKYYSLMKTLNLFEVLR